MTETNGYLPKRTFFSIMTTLVAIVMAVFGYLTLRVDKVNEQFNHNFTQVSVDIAEIKTDLRLLREDLKK